MAGDTATRSTSVDDRTGMTLLEPAECWRLLREADVGRLAVSVADHPDIFPVNHSVDTLPAGPSVVFRSQAGTKLAAAICGRAVAYEVDGYDTWTGDAWSVVVKGQAEEVTHLLEIERAETLPMFPWNAFAKPFWVRIVPEQVTGRRFHVLGMAQQPATELPEE
jgi:nitroimidazol reductase NimA-like FMN-containing flavoprotein (pyridoxamine 5'-phosphate oxidase superfamily)